MGYRLIGNNGENAIFMDMNKQRLQELAGITELGINKPGKLFNVYIQYDYRLDNSLFVMGYNEEDAKQKALEALNNGEGEKGEEITEITVTEINLNDIKYPTYEIPDNATYNQYLLSWLYEKSTPSIMDILRLNKVYCWDSGT